MKDSLLSCCHAMMFPGRRGYKSRKQRQLWPAGFGLAVWIGFSLFTAIGLGNLGQAQGGEDMYQHCKSHCRDQQRPAQGQSQRLCILIEVEHCIVNIGLLCQKSSSQPSSIVQSLVGLTCKDTAQQCCQDHDKACLPVMVLYCWFFRCHFFY